MARLLRPIPQPRPHRALGLALLAALVAAVPLRAAAQRSEESVPIELAMVLLGGRGAGDILVGDVPEEVRSAIPLRGSVRVVGAWVGGPGFGAVVLGAGGEPRDALEAYERDLEKAGWTRAPPPGVRTGGFQGSGLTHVVHIWCSASRSLDLAAMRAGGATYLRLGYRGREDSGCDVRSPVGSGNTPDFALLPMLYPPDEAVVRGGGVGGSLMSLTSDTPIETDRPIASVADHYGDQLVAHGWGPVEPPAREEGAEGEAAVLRRYRLSDDAGAAWVGLLVLWRVGPGALHAQVRLDRVEGR